MTVASETNKTVAQGNGITTVFTYNFNMVAAGDATVIYTDASGVQTTLSASDYTLVINADPSTGGSVTYPLSGAPIAVGATLTIAREVPLVQDVTFSNQGAVYPDVTEAALDYLTYIAQQLNEAIARAIIIPIVDADNPLPLPAAAQRAGMALLFDSLGNPIAGALTDGVAAISAAMLPVVQAATLALARVALGLGTAAVADTGAAGHTLPFLDIANTFSADQTIVSTDASAAAGPFAKLHRNSASPAVADILGVVDFQGKNSAAATKSYARLKAAILDPVAATEDGQAIIEAIVAGAITAILTLGPGAQIGAPTGGDKGAGTINAQAGLYVAGFLVPLTRGFVSSGQAITSAGTLTIAHGLGIAPVLVFAELVCGTGELGFSANDVLAINPGVNSVGLNAGIALTYDATNLKVTFGSAAGAITVVRKDTGAGASITNGDWTLRLRAFA